MAGRQSDDAWRRRLRAVVKRYWKKQWAVAEDAGVAQAGHLEAGTPGVCIEFEMPPEHELLSDFDLWHFVFGQDTYIATTLDEMELLDEWEAKDTDIYSEAEIRASWNRIFDLDFSAPDIASPRAEKWIQGTVWEVPLTAICDVQAFASARSDLGETQMPTARPVSCRNS